VEERAKHLHGAAGIRDKRCEGHSVQHGWWWEGETSMSTGQECAYDSVNRGRRLLYISVETSALVCPCLLWTSVPRF
jgi:hypothetical protein